MTRWICQKKHQNRLLRHDEKVASDRYNQTHRLHETLGHLFHSNEKFCIFCSLNRTFYLSVEGTHVREISKIFWISAHLIVPLQAKRNEMDIKTAEFSLSAPVVSMCPEDTKPEYAFIGRSNVGKSSLINMLTNNRKLAKTSATPGKTLLINHFIINREWYLVDLPGYGFAKRSKTEVAKLDQMIRGYILQREQLVNLFVLVDIRLEPQKIDLEFIDWLGQSGVPFSIIFTKADKLSAAKAAQNVEAYKKTLQETWEELPPIFVTSAEKKQGRDDVLNYIEEINSSLRFEV